MLGLKGLGEVPLALGMVELEEVFMVSLRKMSFKEFYDDYVMCLRDENLRKDGMGPDFGRKGNVSVSLMGQ